ncbi:MAG TPA: Hsp20/alpha crystallin family protein [Syntrophorhabdaceae bacterium]|nr:Hsp20/alpha crystallin family protein [Syntrophorhabdaceae bacterium]
MAKNSVSRLSDKESVATRFDEWNPFLMLRSEMDRLFDSYFRGSELERFGGPMGFQPKVNIADSEKDITVSVEIPGMDEKDIELALTKDALTIKGEKREEKEDKGKNYHRMERTYGSFSRTLPLPVEINTDKAEAAYKKGVLTIVLPKTDKAVKETKKIPIRKE